MGQLMRIAQDSGASAVITYVAIDNIPSLRGCANVGFGPNRVRVSKRRILRRTTNHPVDAAHYKVWETATAKAKQPAEAADSQTPQPEARRVL
jgi:hypothetical protein